MPSFFRDAGEFPLTPKNFQIQEDIVRTFIKTNREKLPGWAQTIYGACGSTGHDQTILSFWFVFQLEASENWPLTEAEEYFLNE